MTVDETMHLIQKLSNERLLLYRQAGHEHLAPAQTQRLHEISDQLPLLWDRYRREYAGHKQPRSIRSDRQPIAA